MRIPVPGFARRRAVAAPIPLADPVMMIDRSIAGRRLSVGPLTQLNPDGLGFGVLLVGHQGLVLAAEAGLLVATERHGEIAFGIAVDRHRSGANGAGDAMGRVEVVGIERGGEAVAG